MRISLKQEILDLDHGSKLLVHIIGTSSETKPSGYAGGSIFTETDHADGAYIYMFDEESMGWILQPKCGGGGGGGEGYTKAETDDLLKKKVDKFQGVENKDKFLTVGNDGYVTLVSTPSTDVKWGNIDGNINDQTDLKEALDSKMDKGDIKWGTITGTLSEQTDLKSALDTKANKGDIKWGNIEGLIINQIDLMEMFNTKADKASFIWGNITGDLANQADLMAALNSKADKDELPDKTLTIKGNDGTVVGTYNGTVDTTVILPRSGGTYNYNELENKPKINHIELVGDTAVPVGMRLESSGIAALGLKQTPNNILYDLSNRHPIQYLGHERFVMFAGDKILFFQDGEFDGYKEHLNYSFVWSVFNDGLFMISSHGATNSLYMDRYDLRGTLMQTIDLYPQFGHLHKDWDEAAWNKDFLAYQNRDGDIIATSNGVSWELKASKVGGNSSDFVYCDALHLWVLITPHSEALMNRSSISYSSDLVNWEEIDFDREFTYATRIIPGNNGFIVTSDNSNIWLFTGKTVYRQMQITDPENPSGVISHYAGGTFANGKYYLVTKYSGIFSSVDGVNWSYVQGTKGIAEMLGIAVDENNNALIGYDGNSYKEDRYAIYGSLSGTTRIMQDSVDITKAVATLLKNY